MIIHFAFGSIGKQGKVEQQTKQVIEFILQEKRLLVNKCKEFIPVFPKQDTKLIPSEMFEVTGDGEISATLDIKDPGWLNKLSNDTTIHYLPVDVPMICFTKVSFNKLKSSTFSAEYGKFGLAFFDGFLKSRRIKPVFYYTESSIWNDKLIRRWNYEGDRMSGKDRSDLQREIVSYRKPATLFPSFKESVTLQITATSDGTKLEYLTYDRYPDGYVFTKEKEYRIVFDKGTDYLYFDEGDLFMVIAPDMDSKENVESFFEQNWAKHPKVEVFPSSETN
ncbi:MAG: abortive infection system antitoxin AbiGi family protein [Candidatus Hodarchaeales archaeon]